MALHGVQLYDESMKPLLAASLLLLSFLPWMPTLSHLGTGNGVESPCFTSEVPYSSASLCLLPPTIHWSEAMLLPLLFPVPMIGARAMSRDHLARFTNTIAEHCYGRPSDCSRHDSYAKQRVQYYQWKLMKRYERNLGYRVLATAYDCLVYYVQYWQLMYLLRAISITFTPRSYYDY